MYLFLAQIVGWIDASFEKSCLSKLFENVANGFNLTFQDSEKLNPNNKSVLKI